MRERHRRRRRRLRTSRSRQSAQLKRLATITSYRPRPGGSAPQKASFCNLASSQPEEAEFKEQHLQPKGIQMSAIYLTIQFFPLHSQAPL